MGIFSKQFIDVIEWTEAEDGILSSRYPTEDREIQNGAKLTVRESQMAVFVNEGRVADVFGPGLYTLTTQTLPILTTLQNWDKSFQSPFKSEVYFFSLRLQTDQRWGTTTPITIRDKEFGAVRVRAFGIFAYKVAEPKTVYEKLTGTRDLYRAADLEGQLRNTIVALMTDTLAQSSLPFLDMAANQVTLAGSVQAQLKPAFADLGLELELFAIQNLSLPEELQKLLDDRIGMNMVGDLNGYSKFQMAQSMPIAAANEGSGLAGAGVGLGAGLSIAQNMVGVLNPAAPPLPISPTTAPTNQEPANFGAKFCIHCGKSISRNASFCPECGKAQG